MPFPVDEIAEDLSSAELLGHASPGKWFKYGTFVATLGDQGFVSFANFASIVLIGRLLGPSSLGYFTLLWSPALFLNIVQQSFVVAPMLTLRSRYDHDDRRHYLGGVVQAQLVFALVSSALLFAALHLAVLLRVLPIVVKASILPLACACAAFQLQEFSRRLLQACKRPYFTFVSDCVAYGLQLVGLSGLFFRPRGIPDALWIMAACWGIGCLFAVPEMSALQKGFESLRSVVRSHARFGFGLAATSVFQWLGAYGVLYIAAAFMNAGAIGNIRAVINIAAPINVFAVGMQTFLSIEAADVFRASGIHAMRSLLRTSALRFAVLAITGALVVSLFSRQIIALLFGAQFSVNPIWIAVAFAHVIVAAMFGFLIIYFKTVEHTILGAYSAGLAMIVSLLTTPALVPILSSGGVFVALTIHQISALLLGVAMARLAKGKTIVYERG